MHLAYAFIRRKLTWHFRPFSVSVFKPKTFALLSPCNLFAFMHLAEASIQSNLHCIKGIKLSVYAFPGSSVPVFPKNHMTLAFIYTWQMLLSKAPSIAFKESNYQSVHCLEM